MLDNEIKFRPVNFLAIIKWTMELKTPMLIRSTHDKAFWSHSPMDGLEARGKSRGNEMTFTFSGTKPEKSDYADISAVPYFDLYYEDGQVIPKYRVPTSSIRGAIRNWMIRHLVERDMQDALIPKKGERLTADIEKLKEAGWEPILDLFGVALDTTSESDQKDSKKAGRIRFYGGEILNYNQQKPGIQNNDDNDWKKNQNNWDPPNAPRHIKIRNPIDRITMASKEGGLHSFIEFSPGMRFDITIEILELKSDDFELFRIIKGEINGGMLRFGALSSVGRGRVEIIAESCKKYSLKKSSNGIKPPPSADTTKPDEPEQPIDTTKSAKEEPLDFLYDIEEIKLDNLSDKKVNSNE